MVKRSSEQGSPSVRGGRFRFEENGVQIAMPLFCIPFLRASSQTVVRSEMVKGPAFPRPNEEPYETVPSHMAPRRFSRPAQAAARKPRLQAKPVSQTPRAAGSILWTVPDRLIYSRSGSRPSSLSPKTVMPFASRSAAAEPLPGTSTPEKLPS